MLRITSVQNPHVKLALKLRNRRARQKQNRILIDGARELHRALGAGVAIVEAFICPPLCRTEEARCVAAALQQASPQCFEVSEPVFRRLAFGQRAEGVLGIAQTPLVSLDRICLPPCPLVAVLEGIEKPGNLGAVLRSADGAGLSAVLVADPRTDLFNPNTIRASLGTVFTTPVAVASAEQILAFLRQHTVAIYAARVDAPTLYTEADFRQPAAIVLGSEARGLSERWHDVGMQPIRLPMRGVADSLNVSAAAAVLFYEALRQRRSEQAQSPPNPTT